MIGTDLDEIRTHIEELASETGEYRLVCSRYGDRPVPAADLRFESRAVARAAARATEQYRRALRRYDPRLPCYDVIVHQDAAPDARASGADGPSTHAGGRSTADRGGRRTRSGGVPGETGSGRGCVEFCHRVVAAVFEALAAHGYDGVESAVVDAYFELAGSLGGRDELCVCLLESAAVELATRLRPAEQEAVLSEAATRLGTHPPATAGGAVLAEGTDCRPVCATAALDAALAGLQGAGLLGTYTRSPRSLALADGTVSAVVRLSGYALAPRDGRLPTLPLAVGLYRRRGGSSVRIRATDVGDDWHVQLVVARGIDPEGLAGAPVRTGVS